MNYARIVPVHYDGEGDGPTHAYVYLDEKHIRRIHQLAAAVKKLKAAYIEDWDYVEALLSYSDDYVDESTTVTDKTTLSQAGLLINDDNPLTALYARNILKGYKPSSKEAQDDLREKLFRDWDGSSDCELLQVSNDDFHYRGCIKHTDVNWSTDGIPLKDLPRIK